MMTAEAKIETEKSSRYLQALCGHFSRKVKAEYTPEQGHVDFGVGTLDLRAEPALLVLRAGAQDAEALDRVKQVAGSHLERFAEKDNLRVVWSDSAGDDTRVAPAR